MTTPISMDERYMNGTNSSNLRVCAEVESGADVIIAAGWSHSRVGMALLRLVSEWDGVSKPRRMSQAAIDAYAKTLPGNAKEQAKQAQADSDRWLLHEQKLMLGRVKALPSMRDQLIHMAGKVGAADPANDSIAVLLWWLDKTCTTCHGQQREVIKDTPILSDVVCPVCKGSGEKRLPCGKSGRRLATLMGDCLSAARESLKKRLRHQ